MKTFHLPLILTMSFLMPTTTASSAILYGLTPTSVEEGNAKIVSFDTAELSPDPNAPTSLTELATVAGANDFMGGCSMGDLYYGYYNITDMDTQSVVQYFCTIDFATGNATILHEIDPTTSSNGIYLIDMTYEPKTGMLVALENQYVPSTQNFLSSIQAVNPARGQLSLLYDLDAKYSAICADGEGGYYLVIINRLGDGAGTPVFYKADKYFNVTRLMPPKPNLIVESTMAHSMILLDGKLYLVTGRTVTMVNLTTKSTTTGYLDRDVYGITSVPGEASLAAISADRDTAIKLTGKTLTLTRPAILEIINPQGMTVMKTAAVTETDISSLPSGLYIVRATGEGGTSSIKIKL